MYMVNQQSPTVKRQQESDGFSQILKEAHSFFAEQANVNMLSQFQDIISEDALFSEYVSHMSRGLESDEAEQMEQLMENARLGILQESTINQVSPLVGLSMPTVRKMWVRASMKNAIPTETAKVPAFTISWMEPYMRDEQGNKHKLPDSLRKQNDLARLPKLTDQQFTLPAVNENLLANTIINGVAASALKFDAIDPIISIDSAVLNVQDAAGADVVVTVNSKMDIHNKFYADVKFVDASGTEHADKIFGTIDLETGAFTITGTTGVVKSVNFRGHLTQENNLRGETVSFDIRRKDIRIGTGSHINAPLPIEWLQDTLAIYNIDASVEVVDIMSNVVAQKLDIEIIEFMLKSFEDSGRPFEAVFDVKPAAGFAGTPTEWRHELRTTIEWWATRLKSYTLFTQGYFVIYGNPLDVNLIPDIQWSFKSANGPRGGVDVNYDFGVVTGNNRYQVLSSDNVPQGELVMFMVPTTQNYMTYKYYPYTFNIQRDYISPQNSMVPSLMVTKRHTIEELIPMQVRIKILNNDGSLISSYAL